MLSHQLPFTNCLQDAKQSDMWPRKSLCAMIDPIVSVPNGFLYKSCPEGYFHEKTTFKKADSILEMTPWTHLSTGGASSLFLNSVSPAEKHFAGYCDNLEKGTVSLDIFRINGCK